MRAKEDNPYTYVLAVAGIAALVVFAGLSIPTVVNEINNTSVKNSMMTMGKAFHHVTEKLPKDLKVSGALNDKGSITLTDVKTKLTRTVTIDLDSSMADNKTKFAGTLDDFTITTRTNDKTFVYRSATGKVSG